MKLCLQGYEPTDRTFAGCETPQDLRDHFRNIVSVYDLFVYVHAISKLRRCELVDKLSDFYEMRLSELISEELRDVSEQ